VSGNRFSWTRVALPVGVVAVLLCLAAANLVRRSWTEIEDGVLWSARADGQLVALEVAQGSPGARAGLAPGDLLQLVDGQPVNQPVDVERALHGATRGEALVYTVVRPSARAAVTVTLDTIPTGNLSLYYVLAGVGIFTLLVGASVRLRRPGDQATLHFFWLSVAFFGVMAFSFSGQLDTLDWFFYWADVVALLALPPMFLHFALVFPDRPDAWAMSDTGRTLLPLSYLPALLLGAARVAVLARGADGGALASGVLSTVDRLELLILGGYLAVGLAFMVRALGRVRSVTARRQLRWITWGTLLGGMPFVLGYALPWAFGFDPLAGMEFTAILIGLVPLAFASAIVRYRLMDVEVIIKRGLVYAAAVAAIAAIYAILLQVASRLLLPSADQHNTVIAMLATLVVVLLAGPVKNAIQTALDKVYYRDRYDYRRALVGFARDLNSDLDLLRLSERLVTRVRETLLVDRIALMLAPLASGSSGDFTTIASAGFEGGSVPVRLARGADLGTRLMGRHIVAIDDPITQRRVSTEELVAWRDAGIHYFVPCVSKEGTIAVMALGRKPHLEPLSSEDMALLAAVAGQVATALENARLYRELRVKADEVERMREFSESILESLTDGLLVVDTVDRVVRWNPRLEALTGIPRADAVGRPLDQLFDAEFLAALRRARHDQPAGATLYRTPVEMGPSDARHRLLVNVATAPLRTPSGATAGTIVVLEDITGRVQLEEQLQISEKMASIGLLAAGVAHEVNTPLTGISSFTQMLLEQAEPDDPRTRLLEKIERQTFRAAKIVNGLLNLARPARVDRGPVDLHAVVSDVLSLLEHQFKTGRIQVRKEFAPRAPVVEGSEYKLQQVFLNLFLNARDAMPKGGWLTIATRASGDAAVVEVADTGSGIAPEHLSRIYDPFFTTKAIGQGTGLGLSITYGILQEHGGSIACESAVGQGTRFQVTLPLAVGVRTGEAVN